jgi:hypothetical protein
MKTRLFIALALVLAACGGGDAATDTTAPAEETVTTAASAPETTAAEESTTTEVEVDEATTGDTILVDSLDDIPQVCRDTFVAMLQTVEPTVEDVDFDTITVEELDPLFATIDADMTAFDEDMTANECDLYSPDVADESVWQEMLDLAESEAPGSVAFLAWTRELATSFAEGGMGGSDIASGDCATDGDALLALAQEGVTMQQMTMDQVSDVTGLLASVTSNCTVEQMSSYLEDPAVVAMLG